MLINEIMQLKRLFDQTSFPSMALPHSKTALLASLNSSDSALSGSNRQLLGALGRLGQKRLLMSELLLFVRAEAHTELGVVRSTADREFNLKKGSVLLFDLTEFKLIKCKNWTEANF